MPRRKDFRPAVFVLWQFADKLDFDDAQLLLALVVGRHGRTEGGNQGERNGRGAIHLQQGADFGASFGIDVGAFFGIEQDDGMGAGYGNDAAHPRNRFGVGFHLILRHCIWTVHKLVIP